MCDLQAMDLATFIQSKKDMGCRAKQVLTIEEGVSSQGPETQQFWTILGGQTAYQRKVTSAHQVRSGQSQPGSDPSDVITLQRQVLQRTTSSSRAPSWRPTASSGCWTTNWCRTTTSGGRCLAAPCWSPRRSVGL